MFFMLRTDAELDAPAKYSRAVPLLQHDLSGDKKQDLDVMCMRWNENVDHAVKLDYFLKDTKIRDLDEMVRRR